MNLYHGDCAQPYQCIVADPPWKFADHLPGKGRGAAKHYDCMTVEQICGLKLPEIAPDAILFLWRVASMSEEALQVVRAWGFTPKSEIVWVKTTKRGNVRMGMGRTVRNAHEICIVATRGRHSRLIDSHRELSVVSAQRREHSEKPAEFYALVERLCVGPRLELFARRHRPGWACVGSELGTVLEVGRWL